MSSQKLGRVLGRYKQRRQPQPHSTPAQLDAILATRQGREKVDQNLAVANRCNWSCSIAGSLVPCLSTKIWCPPQTSSSFLPAPSDRSWLQLVSVFASTGGTFSAQPLAAPAKMLSSHGSPPNSNLRLHANSQLASFPSSACTVQASLATPGLGLASSGVGPVL